MSNDFPGNPWAEVRSQVTADTAGIIAAAHLQSYEQRTANLIALYSMPEDRFMSRDEWAAVKDAILERLGLVPGDES